MAIARALVNSPALLLADEPTGNLDSRTSVEIMAILQALNDYGLTIVLVTHEHDIAAYAKRQITFRDGRVIRDEFVAQPRHARAELEVTAVHPAPPWRQCGDSGGARKMSNEEQRLHTPVPAGANDRCSSSSNEAKNWVGGEEETGGLSSRAGDQCQLVQRVGGALEQSAPVSTDGAWRYRWGRRSDCGGDHYPG